MKKLLFISVVLAFFTSHVGFSQTEKTKQTFSYVLKGKVKDAASKKAIYDATVVLTGSDGSEEVIKTDKKGTYIFDKKPDNTPYLKENTSYSIEIKKEDYKSEVDHFSTAGEEDDADFNHDFFLEKVE